jgi:hypothetical protein
MNRRRFLRFLSALPFVSAIPWVKIALSDPNKFVSNTSWANDMGITTVQWESQGGMRLNLRIMSIIVPDLTKWQRFKSSGAQVWNKMKERL